MAMTPSEQLEAVFEAADEQRKVSGLPEPSLDEVVACCEQGGEGIQARLASWDDERYESPECDWGEPVGEEIW